MWITSRHIMVINQSSSMVRFNLFVILATLKKRERNGVAKKVFIFCRQNVGCQL